MDIKVFTVKPWTTKIGWSQGLQGQALDGGYQRDMVEHCTEQVVAGAKVCRVKPWTEMCDGCQGLQGQALD